MNLNEFIFLTEGLLKIPPVLSQDIKDFGLEVLAKETLNKLKHFILNNEQHLKSLPDSFDPKDVEFLIKEILEVCKELESYTPMREPVDEDNNEWKNSVYLGLKPYIRYASVDKPVSFNHIEVVKFYSYDSDEITFKVKLIGSNKDEDKEFEFNERNNSINTYELSSMLENELNPEYYKEGMKDYQDYYREFQTKLEAILQNQNFQEFDIFPWGGQYRKTLTPEMFVGFNDSGIKQDMIDNITQGKHIIQVDFEYIKSQDQKREFDGVFRKPEISDNLVVYKIELYIPWVEISTYIDWSFGKSIREMNETIDHELGHFIQEIGVVRFIDQHRNDPSRKFGYPPRKLLNKVPGTKTQTAPEYSKDGTKWNHPHGLRDIEFYTRLRDSKVKIEHLFIDPFNNKSNRDPFVENIGKFRIIVGLDPRKYTDGYYPSYQEPDYWLGYLKKNDPGKWNKAVKELYKELKSYLVKPKNYQY